MAEDSIEDLADVVELSLSNKGQRSGKGRGKGEKTTSGRPGQGREVEISKALSKLLRHDAVKEGLELDGEGYAQLDQVLKYRRLQSLAVTLSDIRTAVTDNAKQRFSLKPNPAITSVSSNDDPDPDPAHYLIRANQGHSIPLSSTAHLTPLTLSSGNIPPTVIHGTYFAFYPLILASGGLKPMSRTHVHFSTGLPDSPSNVISGMRSDAELLIYVDVEKSLEVPESGMTWWMSENGVVLTEGDAEGKVPMKYWKLVKGRRERDCGVLWEDGVEVAELPGNLKGRKAPMGKNFGEKGKGKAEKKGKGKDERSRAVKSNQELDALGGEDGLDAQQES